MAKSAKKSAEVKVGRGVNVELPGPGKCVTLLSKLAKQNGGNLPLRESGKRTVTVGTYTVNATALYGLLAGKTHRVFPSVADKAQLSAQKKNPAQFYCDDEALRNLQRAGYKLNLQKGTRDAAQMKVAVKAPKTAKTK